MVPVRRRDSGVRSLIPACAGSPAVPASSGISGQTRVVALQADAAGDRGRDARVAGSSAGLFRTGMVTPERGPDPLRIVDVGGPDADARTGACHSGRARPDGPDRKIRIVRRVGVELPPPFFPVQHVPLAGTDVSAEDGQAGQGGAVLGFLQHVARVVCPGRQLVVPDRGGVAQRAQVGEEPCLIVARSGRPRSPDLQLGTFPLDIHGLSRYTTPAPHHLGLPGRVPRQPPPCR